MASTRTDSLVRGASAHDLKDALRRLLVEADDEFVPPLSSRTSTVQSRLAPRDTAGSVEAYLEALLEQQLLVAEIPTSGVVGFASYRPGHTVDVPGHPRRGPLCYLSTIVVSRAARGFGVGRQLYLALLAAAAGVGQPLTTRTWSGNDAHIALLRRVGLSEVLRLPDDRGPGVDTFYFSTPWGGPR